VEEVNISSEVDELVGELEEFFAWSDFRQIDELPTQQRLSKLQSDIKFANSKGFLNEIDESLLTKLLNFLTVEVRRSDEYFANDNTLELIQVKRRIQILTSNSRMQRIFKFL
jgi:hypothetical protein